MRHLTLLPALLLAAFAAGAEVPEVPAVRFDLLPGGRTNVVVDRSTFPMEAAQAAELRKTLDGLDLARLREEVSQLREALRRAEKARTEAGTKGKALVRESGRVKSAEAAVAELEKRRGSLEDQVQRAQRTKSESVDGLRSQLSAVNQRLAKERKDLTRAKELQGGVRKAKEAAEAAAKSAEAEAGRLRKSAEERLGKARDALKAAGVS